VKIYKVVIPDSVVSKMKGMGFNQTNRLENLKKKLETNPYAGKRLARNLFEKKWGPFRVYYVVAEKFMVVILVDYSSKKDQQAAINNILYKLDDIIEDVLRKYA